MEVMRITDGGWTDTDSLLATAHELWERSKCPNGKSHYADEAWDDDADGWFEVDDSTVCQACAALERWQREHDTHRPEPGTLVRVKDMRREPDED